MYVGLRSLPSAARNRVAVVIAIATSRCMPPVSAVKTVHYSTASHLEEVFHPTEPFRVSAFAAHRERVAFKPHAGDEELLTRAGPLTLDDIRPEERDVAASDHPLHSLRPARQGVRRDHKRADRDHANNKKYYRTRLRGLPASAIADETYRLGLFTDGPAARAGVRGSAGGSACAGDSLRGQDERAAVLIDQRDDHENETVL